MKKIIAIILTYSTTLLEPLSATEPLSTIHYVEDLEGLLKHFLDSSGNFNSPKARHFVSQIKLSIKNQYGIEIDINSAISEIINTIKESNQFSDSEIITAQEFYTQLFGSKEETRESWTFSKKKTTKQKEFVLPDKMASGFILMLGGALLCVIPSGFTQALGTGMITTGLYAVIDGVREGEKPYYIDSETGQRTDQTSNTSVGVGIGF